MTSAINGSGAGDDVAVFDEGHVSNQTLALGYTYNNAGLPFQQTSYSDSAMTTVENQVEDLYNGLGQMIEQYQETSGAVNTGTSANVQWRYSFGSNSSRLAAMTYPNGREEDYGYNAGIDATISRISTIADAAGTDAGTVAAYTYLGLSTIVQEAEPQINTELTYINQSGDPHAITDGGDRYTGLDRFGRVDDQWYLNTSTSTTVDRLQYGYDRDSNVLYQNNLVNGSFSELYHANSATSGDNNSAYDPLSRITSFRRGTLTSSGDNGTGLDTITTANLNSTTGVPTTNQWNYDAIGNWTSSVPGGTSESNTFNSQNEETANGSSSLTYDHNGDMTTDQAGNLYTFDAWGDVIRIASSSNSTEETFSYDALGRAVVNNNGSGTENRYYSGGNIIQEQFSSTNYAQYVYGLAYVNDVILRDRNADGNNSTGNLGITGSGLEEREYAQHDTQFSVISLTNSTGAVMQRFIYDPYGAITVLTPTWAVDGTGGGTNYWLYTFQGMRIVDAPGTSGMLFSATRIYDAPLGRWISQDPAGYVDGADRYLTEGDNTTSTVDPSGLTINIGKSLITKAISAGVGKLLGGLWGFLAGLAAGDLVDGIVQGPDHSDIMMGLGFITGFSKLCELRQQMDTPPSNYHHLHFTSGQEQPDFSKAIQIYPRYPLAPHDLPPYMQPSTYVFDLPGGAKSVWTEWPGSDGGADYDVWDYK